MGLHKCVRAKFVLAEMLHGRRQLKLTDLDSCNGKEPFLHANHVDQIRKMILAYKIDPVKHLKMDKDVIERIFPRHDIAPDVDKIRMSEKPDVPVSLQLKMARKEHSKAMMEKMPEIIENWRKDKRQKKVEARKKYPY